MAPRPDTQLEGPSAPQLRRLWRDWMRPQWPLFAATIVTTLVVAGAQGAYAKLIQLVMEAFQSGDTSAAWWAPVAVITLTSVGATAQYIKDTTSARAINRIETEMRKEMFARLVGTDLARLQSEAPAGLASRFSSDIGIVGRAIGSTLGGFTGILTIIFTFGVMISIDWSLTLAIFAIFLVAVVPVNIIGRRLKKLSRRTQAQVATMSSQVTEGLASIRMARTYRLEEPLAENADTIFERLFGLRTKQNQWQARISPLMEVLLGLAVALLLVLVARRINAGTMSIADFTGLLTGLGIVTGPARRIGGTYAVVMQGRAALDRVFMLYDVKNTILDGPRHVERVEGAIRYEQVSFAYPDGHVALREVDLDIAPGRRVAFVGRSGAGKSTVFNLLPRLYDPTEGRILIDGMDIREMTLASLRDQIAVVSQDSVLLTGTVASNIGFGRRGASRAEIEAAAQAAAADGFIRALPQGYDTPVSPSEQSFSGGERQRLSIARAMLRDAPILLLDEPTSALDAESEAQIRLGLDRLARGRTTLVIAHRLATVLDADLIVVMDHGRIVEQGTHAELLAREGLYADLYALQFALGGETAPGEI